MESTENKCSVVKIESVQNKNLVIETLADYRAKDKVKTSTYYLNLANGSKENQDISYVSIDNVSQENTQFDNGPIEDSTTEYVAVEVQDSGQIILHEKNVILWDELCRICANGCDQFIPIFTGEGFENNLSQKIHEYLPIQISENDDLPHQLCYNCASTLIAYDDIYKGCISAQERLNSLQSKLNKQELVNNSIAEDDDHFEQVLEDKTEEIDVNKDKLEENGDALDENYEEGDRNSSYDEEEKSETTILNSFTYMCGVCEELYPAENDLLYHMRNEHQVETHRSLHGFSYECNVCKKTFFRKNRLINHIEKKHTNPPTSSNEEGIIERAKFFENGKVRFRCDFCDKILTSRIGFIRHHRNHRDERPMICETCGKTFRIQNDLTRHINDVHKKIKKYACDICNVTFAAKSTRDAHRRIHTGEKPYPCKLCPKTFRSVNLLWTHSQIHADVRRYKCHLCTRAFRCKQKLEAHICTHTGIRPYPCDVCGKKFAAKSEATRHRSVHSKEKPFLCSHCGLGFRINRYLKMHVAAEHSEESQKPKYKFNCFKCGVGFNLACKLNSHLKSQCEEKLKTLPTEKEQDPLKDIS